MFGSVVVFWPNLVNLSGSPNSVVSNDFSSNLRPLTVNNFDEKNQLTPPKTNIATLVNPSISTPAASLFSKEQS